jgi:hypothetical protein
MAQLYVGNVSKQIHQFSYRALEKSGVITQPIQIGGQVRVAPNGHNTDLTSQEIDYILAQHSIYGITPIDELDTNKNPFFGLVYSIGKPIPAEKLSRAMRKQEDYLRNLGQKMRQEAALAVNSQIEEQIGAPLRQLEMSIAEEEPRSGYAEDLDHVAEGVRVTREAAGAPAPVATTRRKGKE